MSDREVMMSNDLLDLMRKYGVEVKMLGTDEEPSPDGVALGAMLTDIHDLGTQLAAERARVERLRRLWHTHECPPCNRCSDPDDWDGREAAIALESDAWDAVQGHDDLEGGEQ